MDAGGHSSEQDYLPSTFFPSDVVRYCWRQLRRAIKKRRRLAKLKAVLERNRSAKEAARREYERTRPRTAAETETAIQHLKIAHNYLAHIADKIPDNPRVAQQQFLQVTSAAAKHIDQARNIAPGAVYKHEDEKTHEATDYSVDDLAARSLFWEGYANTTLSIYSDELQRGIEVLLRGKQLSPFVSRFDRALGEAYLRLGRTEEGRKYLNQHLRSEPDDFEAHKMLDGVKPLWHVESRSGPPKERSERSEKLFLFVFDHPHLTGFLVGAASMLIALPIYHVSFGLGFTLFGGGIAVIVISLWTAIAP
jgi:hypothetical protein